MQVRRLEQLAALGALCRQGRQFMLQQLFDDLGRLHRFGPGRLHGQQAIADRGAHQLAGGLVLFGHLTQSHDDAQVTPRDAHGIGTHVCLLVMQTKIGRCWRPRHQAFPDFNTDKQRAFPGDEKRASRNRRAVIFPSQHRLF